MRSCKGRSQANPRLGVAGGFIRNVDDDGTVLIDEQVGSFDWFLRSGVKGDPPEGIPAYFFPEGACMVRRDAFLAAGGFYGPFFFTLSEIDAAMRLAANGWETRYFPRAPFAHLKRPGSDGGGYHRMLYLRVRNELWHFWLRYPPAMAIPRMLGYLAFDLVECVYRREPRAWLEGRARRLAPARDGRGGPQPAPRAVIREVERNRAQMHVSLLWEQLRRKLTGRHRAAA